MSVSIIVSMVEKRDLDTRGNEDSLDSVFPAKRLRTGSSHESQAVQNAVESPAQVDDIGIEDDDVAIQIAPVPVLDDLYLETVRLP